MKTRTLKNLAGVSAVALGTALFGANAAQAFTVAQGVPFTIAANMTVNNTFSVTTTQLLDFGTFGTVSSAGNGATGTLSAAGAFTGSTVGAAKVVDGGLADHKAAQIDITGLQNAEIFTSYGNVVELKGAAADILEINSLVDDMTTPGGFTTTVHGDNAVANTGTVVSGVAVLDATGARTVHIGGVIATKAQATLYASQLYSGSFDLTVSY